MSQTNDRWRLYEGRDPRGLPAYTSSEAARYLRLPLRTVQNWSFGFRTGGADPLIHIADRQRHLLSFWNMAELHVLGALRRYHRIPPGKLRNTIRYLEDTFKTQHPLLTKSMLTDGVSIFVEHTGTLINATRSGQLAMRQLMEAHLQRIEQDVDGLAIRLFPFVRHDPDTPRPPEVLTEEPKIIALDPRVRFGRPVIAGTSIPTEEIAERFRAGDSLDQLADEYGRPPQEIEEAIRCELTLDRAA
ncbi:MAG: DUF433 domain-containing protein [Acidobacteria bacterium]|nr:DUF433 domain-containing protein [Acidobacteriota bacterium]MXZ69900.1 DUF433 domain-containing protein [Acidobacteriota bacterium]MYJ04341.1 DUF433 domain-containing protein [Acidobacteriota bacterium]